MYYSSTSPAGYPSTSSVAGIQGQLLEVTVVCGTKLKNTEWLSRQDPYVCLEYGNTKFRTRTCTDGGRNPTFQEKFTFSLIEGLPELKVVVWNSNTINLDDFIGTGIVRLQKVLSAGYDDSSWPLQCKSGRSAGEIRLIMHYPNAKKQAASYAPLAPPYHSQTAPYSTPPSHVASYPMLGSGYPAPSPYPSHHPNSASPYPNPQSSAYPPPSAYPPQPYPPPSAYPPSPYPPTPQSSSYPSPGAFPGIYRPPPY